MLEPDERARLQGIAFGREASDAQRQEAVARLVEAEAPGPAESAPEHSSSSNPAAAPPEPRSARRRWSLAVIAAGAALLVAAVVAVVAAQPRDSLDVFDRRPTAEDDAVAEVVAVVNQTGQQAETRLLYSAGELRVAGLLDGTQVCLVLVRNDMSTVGGCSSLEAFQIEGVSFESTGTPDADGNRPVTAAHWGPTGDVRVSVGIATPPPPAPPAIEVFDRDQADRDLGGLERIPGLTATEAASLRWAGEYQGLDLFAFRPDRGSVCAVLVERGSIVGEVSEMCVTEAEFLADGVTVPWSRDGWLVTWGPRAGIRVSSGNE
jgi:hypothetical protein